MASGDARRNDSQVPALLKPLLRELVEHVRLVDAGQGDAAGRHQAKALRPGRRQELVDTVRKAWAVSVRRACTVLKAERSSCHYKSRRGDQAELKKRIKEIAEARVRYGYRRIHGLLVPRGLACELEACAPALSRDEPAIA